VRNGESARLITPSAILRNREMTRIVAYANLGKWTKARQFVASLRKRAERAGNSEAIVASG